METVSSTKFLAILQIQSCMVAKFSALPPIIKSTDVNPFIKVYAAVPSRNPIIDIGTVKIYPPARVLGVFVGFMRQKTQRTAQIIAMTGCRRHCYWQDHLLAP